jgi:hypothetical protein
MGMLTYLYEHLRLLLGLVVRSSYGHRKLAHWARVSNPDNGVGFCYDFYIDKGPEIDRSPSKESHNI